MRNQFIRELDRWLFAILYEKMRDANGGPVDIRVGATEFARMISDYVLLRVAGEPDECWTACGIDDATDAAIQSATTFSEDLLAAGFIGAACELGSWHGPEGIDFMTQHGVPAEDAQAISSAVEVVIAKLGARGQALIHRLAPTEPRAAAQ